MTYRSPSIVNGKIEGYGPPQTREVVSLQRNGYLRVREPAHGTTVDVHHTHATAAAPTDIPAGTKAGRAVQYAQGLTANQLLAKLAAQGIDHPGGLAQSLGLDGKGSPQEVARRIAKLHGPGRAG